MGNAIRASHLLEEKGRPARVMIVDDDPDILAAFRDVLELEGDSYIVETATNSFGAIIKAKDFLPDIALLDIKLESSNGLNLIRFLKNNVPGIVCMAMTAYRNMEYAIEAIRCGADDYLHKPIEAAVLLDKIEQSVRIQRRARQAEQWQQRFREIFDQTLQFLFISNKEGVILDVNEASLLFLGMEQSAVVGQNFFSAPWCVTNTYTAKELNERLTNVVDGTLICDDVEVQRVDGEKVTLEFSFKPILDSDGKVDFILYEGRDITEFKAAQQRVAQFTPAEQLDTFSNRKLFDDRLAITLSHAQRHARGIALMLIDFAQESLSSEQIVGVACRLNISVREEDAVLRLTEGKFALILTEVTEFHLLEEAIKRIVEAVTKPFHIHGREVFVAANVGVATFPEDSNGAEDLMAKTEKAVLQAKRLSNGDIVFYSGISGNNNYV